MLLHPQWQRSQRPRCTQPRFQLAPAQHNHELQRPAVPKKQDAHLHAPGGASVLTAVAFNVLLFCTALLIDGLPQSC